MSDKDKSPAVVSMEREQERQRSTLPGGELDKGLEDSFPASDPVAMVSTGVPSGRADTDQAAKVHRNADAYAAVSKTASRGDATALIDDVRTLVRENPFTAIGLTAALAFLWGASR